MKCPACGSPEMVEQTKDVTLSSGGRSIIVEKIGGEFCPNCGEGVLDSEGYRRLTDAQRNLVNAVRDETGSDIRRIRKSLKLTQAKLAANLGLGKLALSRYEQGKTQPSVPLVKLLRLIEKHPNLLDELAEIEVPCQHVETGSGGRTRRKRAVH